MAGRGRHDSQRDGTFNRQKFRFESAAGGCNQKSGIFLPWAAAHRNLIDLDASFPIGDTDMLFYIPAEHLQRDAFGSDRQESRAKTADVLGGVSPPLLRTDPRQEDVTLTQKCVPILRT